MEERKYYPLTKSQQVMFINLNFCYKKSVVNICALADLFSEINADVLFEAMKISLKRNKSAGGRLSKQGKEYLQYFVENEEPENIFMVDLSDKNDEQREKIYKKWGSKPFPNKTCDTQPYRLYLIKRDSNLHSIYLCVSHIFFDAYAVMLMLDDIFNVYHAMVKGEPVPPCNIDPLPAYEADWAYQKTEKYQKDEKYWDEEVLATEPQFSSIGGLNSKEYKKNRRSGAFINLLRVKGKMINLPFEKELTDKVNNYAMEHNMSPQNIFYLAIRSYLSKVCGNQEDISIMNNLARRGTVAQKRAGGTMVNANLIRTIIPNNATFAEGCDIYNKTFKNAYRHGTFAFNDFIALYQKKYNTSPLEGYYSFSVTYQPVIGVNVGDIKYSFRRMPNGADLMPLYLTIMPKDNFSGELLFNYEYLCGYTKLKDIYKVHEFIKEFVAKGIDNPEITLEELMK